MNKHDTCEHCGHARMSHTNGRGSCSGVNLVGNHCQCNRFKKSEIEVSIKPLPELDREIYIVINKKGYCYYINSARPFLSEI